jgi:hypothetical protein
LVAGGLVVIVALLRRHHVAAIQAQAAEGDAVTVA